jgi:hypothetical protein
VRAAAALARAGSAVRASLLAIGLLSGCGSGGASSTEPSAPAPAGSAVAPAPAGQLAIDPADRTCVTDAECTAVLTQCSMCQGACTGVRGDRAARYDGKLDCRNYGGFICNYDCRPRFKIESPRCVSGRCESVRNP